MGRQLKDPVWSKTVEPLVGQVDVQIDGITSFASDRLVSAKNTYTGTKTFVDSKVQEKVMQPLQAAREYVGTKADERVMQPLQAAREYVGTKADEKVVQPVREVTTFCQAKVDGVKTSASQELQSLKEQLDTGKSSVCESIRLAFNEFAETPLSNAIDFADGKVDTWLPADDDEETAEDNQSTDVVSRTSGCLSKARRRVTAKALKNTDQVKAHSSERLAEITHFSLI